jgi:hypothetical protein
MFTNEDIVNIVALPPAALGRGAENGYAARSL